MLNRTIKFGLLLAIVACPGRWAAAFQNEAPAAAAQDAQPAAEPGPPPEITSPLVHALLETEPSTPDELMQAIETVINLKHDFVAKQFITQLLGLNLDRDQMAALARRHGTTAFLRLSTRESVQPEGRQLADAVLAAYSEQARDPARLAEVIERLKSSSPDTRYRALAELRRGGPAAVLALIGVLADPARSDEHEMVRTALVTLGSEPVPPLMAVLASDNDPLRVQAVDVLRRLRAAEAIPYLVAPAYGETSSPELQAAARTALSELLGQLPDKQTAAGLLYTRARTAYDAASVVDPEGLRQREVWRWDADAAQPVAETIPVTAAELRIATRLAQDLKRIMPDSPRVQRLYLSALLESAAIEAGLDRPLPQGEGTPYAEAAAAGPAVLEALLAETMANNHLAAATAVASLLGDVGSSQMLVSGGPQPSVLVQAAYHADRRLRFTAVDSIMKLNSATPYPGASQVLGSLAYFAGTRGAPRAMVVDSSAHEAARLAGLLANMGYDTDIATDGRLAREHLAASSDFELVLLDYQQIRVNVDEWIQLLRRDHRTAQLPVGLVTPLDEQLRARPIAARDALTSLFARPQDVSGMEFQVNRLLQTNLRAVTLEERQQQAIRSLEWLAKLAAQPSSFYSLPSVTDEVETAIFTPELTILAAQLLADLGTPSGQQTLVAIASRATHPIQRRQAAAAAFARGVARYGILLTNAEIQAQYDRYNLSEHEPAESQEVLGSLLDTLESRALKKVAIAPPDAVPPALPAAPAAAAEAAPPAAAPPVE